MSSNPFVVHVARLRRSPGSRWHEERCGPIESEQGGPADSKVPLEADVCCVVDLDAYEGGIMATGTVSSPWTGVCRRCTKPVSGVLNVAVRERFSVADPVWAKVGAHGGVDEEPVDDEAYPIVDDLLDLSPMVRDALMLELPLAPLCDEDCKGLCVHCGIDLNEAECDCVAPKDPRWANLDLLRSPPEDARPA